MFDETSNVIVVEIYGGMVTDVWHIMGPEFISDRLDGYIVADHDVDPEYAAGVLEEINRLADLEGWDVTDLPWCSDE